MAENKNIDDETRKRALASVEKLDSEGYDSREYRSDPYSEMTQKERDARFGPPDKYPPAVVSKAFDEAIKRVAKDKPRVVSKKELEDSGLSLRDFLNKERGLTRRKDKSEDKKESKSDDKVEAAKKRLKLGEKPTAKEVEDAKKQLNLAKGGMIKNQGIGASMKPHNMFGKKK
jgi:hypothetical protein